MRKMYVLTECNGLGNNYRPIVFNTIEEAKEVMIKNYNEYIRATGEQFIEESTLYETSATIVYFDDSVNQLDIYEVEIDDIDN